ncbi:flagellar hook assembly protein FlgD [Chthonobacter rhizosphaerae]|uniref:flagellar hook assembly protein FlgD n=1 Tax=Chthonobacter rhizosphaerae TaxID=2735553 RepID=UPI0015EF0C90|nr:flagellar hook capping FlgD N-terminal domain-containing protein [Chthonobacter rhizosphaerae]
MATVGSSTGSTGTTTQTSSSASATQKVLANYDTFLSLLTTQLRVQNPLEPMDAEKFTEQLVQFSAVEQQIQTNKNLEAMLSALVSGSALNLVNYIGKTIEAESSTTKLENGQALWKVSAASAAPRSTATIRNSAGAVVFSGPVDLTSGENTYAWDGKTATGATAPDGNYTITFDARSGTDATVAVTTRVSGTVTAIDTSTSEPFLTVNGAKVPLSEILSVRM